MWFEVIRTTSLLAHLRATPEEDGVGIWAVVFKKNNPVIKRESQVTIWDLCRSSPDRTGPREEWARRG
jgi:hypothetical protein